MQILRRETHEECTMLMLLLTFPLTSSSEGERCKFESLPTYEASALWRHDPTYGLMDHPQNWGLPPGGGVMLICQHWDHLIIITIKIWPRSIYLQPSRLRISNFCLSRPFSSSCKNEYDSVHECFPCWTSMKIQILDKEYQRLYINSKYSCKGLLYIYTKPSSRFSWISNWLFLHLLYSCLLCQLFE